MRGGQGRLYRGVCILLGLGLLTFGGWQAAGQPGIAVLETQVTRVKQAAQYLSVPLPTATATATPTATPAATPAAAIGLDSSALDAFCAAQAGSFSVYVKDLSSGEEYFFGTDAEYYPASILKAAYALWLCEMGEAGLVDLSGAVYNFYGEELASGALAGYAASETIPVWDALYTMIAQSDNQAVRLLAAVWPGNAETGFSAFLWELGFHAADSCAITMEEGIEGVMSIEDAGILMNALYEYFDTDTELARQLRACFLDAGHTALYIPVGVEAAKKYGSWDAAFHDMAIVYAAHPYILCCMTDQGDAEIDFPAAPVAAMQQLGQLVYSQLNAA